MLGVYGSCGQLRPSMLNSKHLSACLQPVNCKWLQQAIANGRRSCWQISCSHKTEQNSYKPPRPGKPTNIADLEGSPFHELGLKEITDGMGKTRVRQHVNPLTSKFQQPTPAPDWAGIYKDPHLPLFVDMGCGPGRFLLLLCKRHQQLQQPMNYLGLEIRQPLVERANKWAQELDLDSNVHYLFTNVSVSLAGLLKDYPGQITTLSAQFPDPLFKKKHKKRRMVQQSVVQAARELLVPGGTIFLQSDIYDAVCMMRDEFEQHAGDVLQLSPLHSTAATFQWSRQQEAAAQAAAIAAEQDAKAALKQQQRLASMQRQQQEEESHSLQQQQQQPQGESADITLDDHTDAESMESDANSSSAESVSADDASGSDGFISSWAEGGWLVENPLGVPTEREHYVHAQGGKVFRVLLEKKR